MRLTKKKDVLNSVEAYMCVCGMSAAACYCYCDCGCDSKLRVSDGEGNMNGGSWSNTYSEVYAW